MALTASSEDYLRAIWKLGEWKEGRINLGDLTRELGLSPSTVSEGVARLTAKGLLRHAPYGGISLTDEGRAQAVRMVRIHRLLETGLVQLFGYSWDEVHDEAETLEHAVSDVFIDRLDAALGYPRKDPHGEVIPAADGTVASAGDSVLLAELGEGRSARIERVSDRDSDVLVYLEGLGLVPAVHIETKRVRRAAGIMDLDVLRPGEAPVPTQVSLAAARAVVVVPAAE
ncbi:MAG: metal-dependent transcriptional regulator [Ancrocorticia sp.]|jgi:DtxR family Mn-dependent transcriptional regulator|nr:metal-dependent transcriptional regulator [Ancrocorticia sp.]MCI2012211.1 metal-dependent transcriptional regulator [Ancrocorticia sp.]MCI2028844.1 metal-dependent transcriptional regulator [Ancrocorticia sp.]